MAATGHPRLSKLVRLYVIDNQGKATYITVDIDGVSTADEYIYQWQYKLNLPYGEAIAMTAGRAMVPTRLGSDKAWHKRTVDGDGDFMPSVRATMQTAVKYTPDNSAYGLVFLNTGAWNGAQFEAATAIVHDRSKEASADTALPVNTAKKSVRVYICSGTFSIYVEFQPDDVVIDEEKTKHAFANQLPRVPWEELAPTNIVVPREERHVEQHSYIGDCGGSFVTVVNRAITLATRACPARAPHAIVFLRGFHTVNTHQIIELWRASFDDKYILPMPAAMVTPVETPLERWYNAHKKFKAAEETLLKCLKEALVEKTRCHTDIEFTDNTEALLAFMLKSTKNTVFLGHPARFAAYEACGLRFGPVLACPELYLASLSSVYASGDIVHQVRMSDFPWVSKEQD